MSTSPSHGIALPSILLLLSILSLSSSLRCSAPLPDSSPVTEIDEGSRAERTGRSALAVPTCVDPPPDLVGWWPGEGDATDIAGDNDGTIIGATFETGRVRARRCT